MRTVGRCPLGLCLAPWDSTRLIRSVANIGSPLFPEVKMHVGNGKTFTVLAPEVSAENIYIQSVKLNGQPYDKSYITHEQIMSGATLEFVMGSQPGPVWYTNE